MGDLADALANYHGSRVILMPVGSVYYSILEAVGTVITNLNLNFTPPGGVIINPSVTVLKEPKFQRQIDSPMPVIMVAPSIERQVIEQASAEGYVFVTYPVEVAISAAGNRDFVTNIDIWLNWRQQIRSQFCATLLPGVSQVFLSDADPDPAWDRELIQSNYDRSSLTLRFKTIEPRGAI